MKLCVLLLGVLSGLYVSAQNNIQVQPVLEHLPMFDKIRDFTMDANGKESYFTVQSPNEEVSVIVKSIFGKNGWDRPTIASFSGKYKDLEPFLSPDGLRLYFVSNRPMDNTSTTPKDFDIWYVERASKISEWSAPINIEAPINTEHNEFYPAVAQNGNLYYTCDCPGALGRDDIFFSSYKNGGYAEPISLSGNINSEGFEYNSYISPDDSYLIFGGYNREDGQGSGDLYVSFKDDSGNWTKAIPLPTPINSKYMDYCPFVDLKNNVLYFTSRRSQEPGATMVSMDDLLDYLNSYENGGSRLYKAQFDILSLK
ncbi:PD40 domain-containing protein [Flagellimonas algicola]|uniref:WD40 repeat protein n=1 Tax=Flagellimonas algicola TaxID=2583815 RepID=A0ABY2WMW3_9FLAO|nr:PD40 domain-containing protein [Allomuricauda algicola]TMU56342.1 hypothetical protein FGG15_02035 [Allomuricauda algicola]